MQFVTGLVVMAAVLFSPAVKGGEGVAGWRLVWADEFDYVGTPDSRKWDYEVGYLRNKEAQFYTKEDPQNAYVSGGFLRIVARKVVRQHEWRGGKVSDVPEYSSASLMTFGKAAWKYGRVDVRARLPKGAGVWPAIWLLGENCDGKRWPAWGEIDIMEYHGRLPGKVFSNVHYSVDGKSGYGRSKQGSVNLVGASEFHVYSMEWSEDRIDFFLDGVKYHSFIVSSADSDVGNPFRRRHYLLINFALGGTSGGGIDDSVLPQSFDIDYVRVYEKLP